MSSIHKTVNIDAPIDQVFEVIDHPENFPRYVPNVSEVVDIQRTAQRTGDTFRVIYKVLGLTFDMKFTTDERVQPTRIISRFEGGMSGTYSWNLEPDGSKTKLTVDIDYTVSGGALGKAVDLMVLERTNDKSIEGMVENLRRLVEKAGQPAGS